MAEMGADRGHAVAVWAAGILAVCSGAFLLLGFPLMLLRPDECIDETDSYNTLEGIFFASQLAVTALIPICLIVAAVMAVRRKASGRSQRATQVVLGIAGGLTIAWLVSFIQAVYIYNCYVD